MSVDIVIVTYYRDFVWLEWCFKSIKKFASGFRKVIVISDGDGKLIPPELTQIIPITKIYVDVPTVWPKNLEDRPGYLWQQVMKLRWTEYSDADAVMVLDSDEMLCRPTTPQSFKDSHGRWEWKFRKWEHAGIANKWKKPTQEVLKFEPEYEAMCYAPFILERNTTHKFIEYLKHIHCASDVYHVFFKYDITLFSEYNAYGSYVYKFDNETVYYNKIIEDILNTHVIKSWSYDEITEEDIERRKAILQ
jgi:hypothetical protein